MTTTTTSETLALLGGAPVVQGLSAPPWPPTTEACARELAEVYQSRHWSFGGPQEIAFAREFAQAHGAKFGVFMANGTVTLQCALGALGIGAGDEVIVPALTWPATAMAALYVGATPVFVDVQKDTLCLDPAAFEAAITPRTRAVIPVHLYGSMADLDAVGAVAGRHHIAVVEDCAHAHGGRWSGCSVGSRGEIGSFSFQQSKTMAAGEGGICITNDEGLAERLYRMKHIGYGDGSKQGDFATGPPPGLPVYNFRATEFQAVILRHQLRDLEARIALYNHNAARIEARLAGVPGVRVQARGRCSTQQSYYAFGVVFDEGPLGEAPLTLIFEALAAEGLPFFHPTYGVVYRHLLFNVPAGHYHLPQGGCPVAECTGGERTGIMLHHWLGADDATIDGIGAGLSKIALQARCLRDYAKTR